MPAKKNGGPGAHGAAVEGEDEIEEPLLAEVEVSAAAAPATPPAPSRPAGRPSYHGESEGRGAFEKLLAMLRDFPDHVVPVQVIVSRGGLMIAWTAGLPEQVVGGSIGAPMENEMGTGRTTMNNVDRFRARLAQCRNGVVRTRCLVSHTGDLAGWVALDDRRIEGNFHQDYGHV